VSVDEEGVKGSVVGRGREALMNMGNLMYEFEPADDGQLLGEPGMGSRVSVDVVMRHGDVHVEEPESTQYGRKVPLTGDTYPAKEAIKRPDWDMTHHEWTGDYWRVDVGTLNVTIGSLLRDGYTVTAVRESVRGCDGLERWHDEVMMDENTTFRFDASVRPGSKVVSRTRAERMAELANYASVESFVKDFEIEVKDDDELMARLGVGQDDERVEVITSRDGTA